MYFTAHHATFAAAVLTLLIGTATAGGVAVRPVAEIYTVNDSPVQGLPSPGSATGGEGKGHSSAAAPILSFTSSAFMVPEGESVMLFWTSVNTTSCTASGAWSGLKASQGAMTLTPSRTDIYILTCTGPGGSVSRSLTVEVK